LIDLLFIWQLLLEVKDGAVESDYSSLKTTPGPTEHKSCVVVVASATGNMLNAASSSDFTGDKLFQSFMQDVKDIERRDEDLTSDKQIERLTKPGSKYLNLNPYEVLQISPKATEDEIKKKFRQLSILVHPDKNPENKDAAEKAFEAVNEANRALKDPEQVKKAKLILEEAGAMLEMKLKEKRREAKKLSATAVIPEDDSPEAYFRLQRAITAKLFADNDIRKQELVDRQQQEKKRERETELEVEDNTKRQKEMDKQWDEGRVNRINDWRSFQKRNEKKVKKNKQKFFKPPALKPESKPPT